jgi:hypothetical protein
VTVNFDFSTNVIPLIIKEINSANAYIRIAIFQLHNAEVLQALSQKLPEVRVEIFTLPFDSINPDIRPKIESQLRELQSKGAVFYFDKWNIGDPSRTTTAVGRWYSFHGKFIVTEKTAIALSANLTQDQEIDAIISFNDEERINEFNSQFDRLVELFVAKKGAMDGSIKEKIVTAKKGESTIAIFDLPKNIGQEHANHWIREYPLEVCSSEQQIIEKLYLTPFDCTGRQILTNLINEAEKFVYISTETFTDIAFSEFLIAISVNKKVEIKILTGGTSMDFTDRLENMLRDLLAHNIEVRIANQELHAKLLVTDKALVVSSINLNKINLGFRTKGRWRENTESAFICKQPDILKIAEEKYLMVINQGQDIRTKLLVKLDATIRRSLSKVFKLKSSPEARKLIANFVFERQLENKQLITKIGKITQKLMQHSRRSKVERQDVVSALILYYLSERKQDLNSLKEKISIVDPLINVGVAINNLEFSGFIEKEADYFKINLNSLF